jgi:hypothetical protein
MSCATKTYTSTLVGFQESDGPASTINQSKSKKYQSRIEPRVMVDSTRTDPEYVWGDEGPIND